MAADPTPPPEMTLLCTCGAALKITQRLYNHRVECPDCGSRMALVLTFNVQQARYAIEARPVAAPPQGITQRAVRAPL